MHRLFRPRRCTLALALAAAGMALPAQALTFVLTDVSGGAMTAEQLGGFQAAANYWSSKLSDDVTVYLNISFQPLGSGVLGQAGSAPMTVSYASLRSLLAADATSATDASAVASLQAGPALSFWASQGNLSTRLDNDGSTNNTLLNMTTANAKAIGLSVGTHVDNPDANITFSTAYASSFAYTRDGGVPANKIDFISVAQHEIGHALGFVSGVDDIDYCASFPAGCALPATVNRFESDAWYYPLDLFRYSAAGRLDVTVGGSPYLSVDGGATSLQSFSTGSYNGNGSQASHFGNGAPRLMRPVFGFGPSYDATDVDLAAFDAIGWDLAAVVPEPAQYALLLGGLAALGLVRRRRG